MGNAENLSVPAMLMAVGGSFSRPSFPVCFPAVSRAGHFVAHWHRSRRGAGDPLAAAEGFRHRGPALAAIALAVILFEAGLELRYGAACN